MGAKPCCMKRKPVKKQESMVTIYQRKNNGVDQRSIKERHENTKEQLNQLLERRQKEGGDDGKNRSITDLSATGVGGSRAKMTRVDHQETNLSPLLTAGGGKFHREDNRGSFTQSKTQNERNLLPDEGKRDLDLSKIKRRSQTYHYYFKEESARKRGGSKKSRKSRTSHLKSNPFALPSSKLVSSSSSSKSDDNIQFHTMGQIGETSFCVTEKAANLHNGKPLVIKYRKC